MVKRSRTYKKSRKHSRKSLKKQRKTRRRTYKKGGNNGANNSPPSPSPTTPSANAPSANAPHAPRRGRIINNNRRINAPQLPQLPQESPVSAAAFNNHHRINHNNGPDVARRLNFLNV